MLFIKKLKKLLRDPKMFFEDRKRNIIERNRILKIDDSLLTDNKTPMFTIHMHVWKRKFIETIFSDYTFFHLPFKLTKKDFISLWSERILLNPNTEILIWGMNCPDYVKEFCEANNIKINYVEDGFLRSVDLGANHSLPLSLNFDTKTLYFNAQEPSDLETILNTYDFSSDEELMNTARRMKEKLLKTNISKYNNTNETNLDLIYGEKTRKRILVIGQVEDDASIKYGCSKPMTNNELVYLAYMENPDAQIIYKPHPDVLFKKRAELSDPNEVKNIALVVEEPLPIAQSFETIDHVYTITSQAGFEALLRDIPVTTFGSPFYSGWGLTDDRQKNSRRMRKLTVDEVFAASYILYPKYFSPITKDKLTPEEGLDLLIHLKNLADRSNRMISNHIEDETDATLTKN